MKSLKAITTGVMAIASAVVFTTSSAVAQDFDRGDRRDRPGMGRGDRDERWGRDDRGGRGGRDDRGRDDRGQRAIYLGTTGLVSKSRIETREIFVRTNEQFRGLEFRARDDDFEMRQVTVYFRNGGSRNLGGARISEGGRVRADFQNYRRIDSIVVQGVSANPFGSKAQLEVYGRE